MKRASEEETNQIGIGLGLRSPHYAHILENKPKVSWFEAISENYMGIDDESGGRAIHILQKVRSHS